MKKLLIGLSLVASISSFALTHVTFGKTITGEDAIKGSNVAKVGSKALFGEGKVGDKLFAEESKSNSELINYNDCLNYAKTSTLEIKDDLEASHALGDHSTLNPERFNHELNSIYSSIYSACMRALKPKLDL